ncbi:MULTISPECIES: translation initiation factor IF-2 [Enterococcus]|uniref:Translation initiation factor IF-2 n=1 Tax=Enterococcus mundtii TaxID=53346 RepID=A0AAI8WCP4_ENTMU|nr:translation initiation factor IF-2 [Enterococcus mundtii]MBE9911169.1 translation initiation factor IF-2 [Enterococcus mundtii]QCJ56639.1 translation initiation factor IF-2 [Enterococcus mundtii]BAO07230.1 initiation factor IF2-1 [Enterococcus mundtii QU 25]BBM13570.1 translation initiation factor IF-2 [Enterococcus mundtii]GKS55433.1 translation initiation factor IF-2 [Enterococcus mundtii]
MGNKRIYELAKEWNKSSKEVVDKAQKLGIDVKNHMGAVSTQDEKKLQQAFNQPQQKKQPVQKANQKPAGQQPSNQKKTNEPSNQQKNKSNRNYQDRGQGSGQVNQGKNQSTNQNKSNQTGGNNQNRQGSTQNNNQNRQGNNQGSNQNRQGTTQGNSQGSNQNRQGSTQGSTQGSNQNRQGANQGGGQNRNNNNNRGKFNNNNRNRFNKKGKKGKQQTSNKPAVPPRKFRELPEVLEYTEGMNVADIAKKIHREPAEIIKKLFMLGVMVNQNQALDKDTIELLATDYGMEPQEKIQVDIADIDKFFEADEVNPEKLVSRPPVVTIMGHVDHGKTTLLDTLRHSRVTSGEAGGITQHIGAYQIDIDGKPITFLDTPGHAAFTSMRARGASITDITILVVAADDGVMPQTVEAINHAKAAGVPIIVAVNKIDKPGANPQHVMQELSEYELIPEAWGGETIFVEISAKFGQNIEELLEMILLVAEVEDLKADPTQRAIGTVIEARLDKGKGPVTTLLVQQGSLNVGDPIVVGNTYGRVRVMVNDLGRREKTAGPATPVEITGLNDVPQAGDRFVVFEDEKTARAAGEERGKRAMLEQRAATSRVTLDNLFESLKEGELKEVNVIIKADVQGSAEALAASLKKIDVEGVRVKIVHSAVGAINESDVTLAAASNAIIIGFNVRPTPQAKIQADTEEVDIRLHRIIYKAIEEIETAMKGMLDPEFEEKITGQMTVRETFKVSKVGTIAGAFVTDGYIRRDSGVRVIRDGIVIFEGQLASLKRFKDDVKEVKMGFECGAMVEKFNDLKVDDVIEGFIMEEIKVD